MQVHPKNKLYGREIKMYFYLANVGFEHTPTSTAAPSSIYIYINIYIYIYILLGAAVAVGVGSKPTIAE